MWGEHDRAGLSLVFDSWWPLALWPLVIRPEEHYLARRFGQTYSDYRSRVRRWL